MITFQAPITLAEFGSNTISFEADDRKDGTTYCYHREDGPSYIRFSFDITNGGIVEYIIYWERYGKPHRNANEGPAVVKYYYADATETHEYWEFGNYIRSENEHVPDTN